MCTSNLSGNNPFGNVEIDEALEETGVRLTKQNATSRTSEALKKCFYTSGTVQKRFESLKTVLKRSLRQGEWQPSNYEKRLSLGAYFMYKHLCGSDDRMAWLGSEHVALEFLANATVSPPLAISKVQTDRLLKMTDIAKQNMDRAGIQFVP